MEITNEQITELMAQVGPASEEIAAVAQNGDAVWTVEFADGSLMLLELDAEQGKLVLSTDLGQPEQSRQAEVYAALLSYNFLWRDTGGVTMALADGELSQIFPLTAVDLTLEQLMNALLNLAEKARVFRGYIAGTSEMPEPGEDAGFPMLRV